MGIGGGGGAIGVTTAGCGEAIFSGSGSGAFCDSGFKALSCGAAAQGSAGGAGVSTTGADAGNCCTGRLSESATVRRIAICVLVKALGAEEKLPRTATTSCPARTGTARMDFGFSRP